MVQPGMINLDFSDVKTVMSEMGKAMMGTGEASGEDRAKHAAEKAIANPLLDEISLRGARGVLINITGSHDLTLFELDEAANEIREQVDPDANIIVGSTLDTEMEGLIRVSVVATGIDASEVQTDMPIPRRTMSAPLKPQAAAPVEPTPEPLALDETVAVADAPAQVVAEEPSLFDGMAVEEVAAQDQAEDIFDEPELIGDDGLPQPVYQTEVPSFEPRMEEPVDEMAGYVAPKAPAPGTPSQETIVRLQQAAQKAAPVTPQRPAPQPQAQPQGGGFGLGSLINRMTGSSGDTPARQQPAMPKSDVAAQPQTAHDPDQEKIEIPAFLRRQAN